MERGGVMSLQERILDCRKKAGFSQEALAAKVGVSRQAVSKWETGEAVPEIAKLLLLADTFAVTTDWLLKGGECATDELEQHTWVDALPGLIGRLVRSYGWLAGVYVAVVGLAFTAIGGLARYTVRRMMRGSIGFPGGIMMHNPFQNMASNDPVSIMGGFMMVVGIVMLIGGTFFAVYFKRRSER